MRSSLTTLLLLFLFPKLCVSVQNGFRGKNGKTGKTAGGASRSSGDGKNFSKKHKNQKMHKVRKDSKKTVQTASPIPRPTNAPRTPSPTVAPTPSPTLPPFPPTTSETDLIKSKSFIPGGTVDAIPPDTVATGKGSSQPYEISGQVEVTSGGIVSLAPINDLISAVTWIDDSASLNVTFNDSIGKTQFPSIFPVGSVLAIDASIFDVSYIQPLAFPPGVNGAINEGLTDAFLTITSVDIIDDFTVLISGTSGSFFNMFSSGNLSIKRTQTSRHLSLNEDATLLSNNDGNTIKKGHRSMENIFDVVDSYNTARLNDFSGVKNLTATWDSSNLDMMAVVFMEFDATINLETEISPGNITSVRHLEISTQSIPTVNPPLVMNYFQALQDYMLPSELLNTYVETPEFLDVPFDGVVQQPFSFIQKLIYKTGEKEYQLSASGPWNNLDLKASAVASTSGSFRASNTISAMDIDDIPLESNFQFTTGVIPTIRIYGSLFSASEYTEVGMVLQTVEPTDGPIFPPLPNRPAVREFGFCQTCHAKRVDIAVRATALEMKATLGNFVKYDQFGPISGGVSPEDLQFQATDLANTNSDKRRKKAVVCLNKGTDASCDDALWV